MALLLVYDRTRATSILESKEDRDKEGRRFWGWEETLRLNFNTGYVWTYGIYGYCKTTFRLHVVADGLL